MFATHSKGLMALLCKNFRNKIIKWAKELMTVTNHKID